MEFGWLVLPGKLFKGIHNSVLYPSWNVDLVAGAPEAVLEEERLC